MACAGSTHSWRAPGEHASLRMAWTGRPLFLLFSAHHRVDRQTRWGVGGRTSQHLGLSPTAPLTPRRPESPPRRLLGGRRIFWCVRAARASAATEHRRQRIRRPSPVRKVSGILLGRTETSRLERAPGALEVWSPLTSPVVPLEIVRPLTRQQDSAVAKQRPLF